MTILWPEVSILEKIVRAAVIYLFLLLAFRLLGKRQVGQMTPFDLIVLLILSNVIQNAMIGNDNSLGGGLIGAVTILLLNFVVISISARSKPAERLLAGVPTILVHQGQIIEKNLRKEGMSREDLLSALRRQGVFGLDEVRWAVLEPTGTVSVLKKVEQEKCSGEPK